MRPLVLVVGLGLVGCWRESSVREPVALSMREPEPPPRYREAPPPSRCDAVVAHLLGVFEAQLTGAGFGDAMVAKLEMVASESCRDQRWPDELLDCFADTQTSDAFRVCQAQMSSEQVDDLQKRMVEVMSSGSTP